MPEQPYQEYRERRKSRARLWAWSAVNIAILLVFTGWVFDNVAQTSRAQAAASVPVTVDTSADAIPTKAEVLDPGAGKYFGVAAANVPWSSAAYEAVAAKAGADPDMVEYFVNWTQGYDVTAVKDAYAKGAVPVLTWESFAGRESSVARRVDQPSYALSTVIDGGHDAYITAFAKAVKAAGYPVVIRLDHEMNGNWFPWSEGVNGNTAGQYVKAWRHVWTLFHRVGATNVIWDWAPNVLRGTTSTDLAEFYPGAAYVDWIGLSAYDYTETTAAAVIAPTLREIRGFTRLPLLVTETGAAPGAQKTRFTESLLAWIERQPDADVLGFIWNEITETEGSSESWGFDTDASTLAAFRSGVKSLTLVKVPAA